MKKIISYIIALTTIGTLLTACVNDKEPEKKQDSAVTLETEEKTENTDEKTSSVAESDKKNKDTTASDNKKETKNKSDSDIEKETNNKSSEENIKDNTDEKDFEKTLYEYFESLNEQDYAKTMRYIYPAEIIDGLSEIAKIQNTDLNALVAQDINANNYEITDIEIKNEMTKDELNDAAIAMNEVYFTIETIKSYGGDLDSLDVKQREEISNIISFPEANGFEVEERYTVKEGYDVTVKYLADGEPDEDYFYVFKVEDEGWMLQNSMRKYIAHSRQSSANSECKTIMTCYNFALIELDEEGVNPSGTFILSSDENKNYNVPDDFSIEDLNEAIGYYYTIDEDCDYFVIICDCVCSYCAVSKFEDTVGTYPVSSIPKSIDETFETENIADDDDYTFEEIYEIAKEIVK